MPSLEKLLAETIRQSKEKNVPSLYASGILKGLYLALNIVKKHPAGHLKSKEAKTVGKEASEN